MRIEWVDVKLAFRVLTRYPALSVVSVVSMSIAVAAVAGVFAVTDNLLHPRLPLDSGHRVVTVANWDISASEAEPSTVRDYRNWRGALSSIQELGAFTTAEQDVGAEGGDSRAARVAEVTASAFRVLDEPPLQGRPLTEEDEVVGSADVAVIGDGLARQIRAGAGSIIGRTILISGVPHTVVGVMPASFGFPFNQSVWVPLRLEDRDGLGGSTRPISVFGRLADGATLQQAQSELSIVGRRVAQRFPQEYSSLRPRVAYYGERLNASRLGYAGVRLGLVLLFLVVGTNVGALVLARNLTREGEIAVRTALGAGRAQIILQLTIEAALLVAFSCALGLLLASWGIQWMSRTMADATFSLGGLPFWWRQGLTGGTLGWVGVLALASTFLCGTVPALMATRFREWVGLQRFASPGRRRKAGSGVRAVIAVQFALSAGVLTMAVAEWPDAVLNEADIPGLDAGAFLTTVLRSDTSPPAAGREARTPLLSLAAREALRGRLRAEPGVAAVTFARAFPGMVHPQGRFEIDGEAKAGSPSGYPVRYTSVDARFFDVMGARVLAGRDFDEGDYESDGDVRPVAIVNESFASRRMGGMPVLGARIRLAARAGRVGRWFEVVGVVQDFGVNRVDPSRPEGVYLPLSAGDYPVGLAVHVARPWAFAPRLRDIVASVRPPMSAEQVRPLSAALESARRQRRIEFAAIGLGALAVLTLTLGGLSALMSFFVSRRTYEVGIRTALGARPSRIVLDIYASALRSLGWGMAIAVPGIIALNSLVLEGGSASVAIRVSIALVGIALLACAPSARRLLEVEPSAAMRAEG